MEQQQEDTCPRTQHVDGKSHGWRFDMDNPYIVCEWCQQMRDALTGKVMSP